MLKLIAGTAGMFVGFTLMLWGVHELRTNITIEPQQTFEQRAGHMFDGIDLSGKKGDRLVPPRPPDTELQGGVLSGSSREVKTMIFRPGGK